MNNKSGTAVRVARVLSVFEYVAISMLVVALITRLTKIPDGGVFCMLGISLLAITPLAGVAVAGLSSTKSRRRGMLPYSIIIVVVYLAALLLAR
jgi:uncharacterized membrane protein